jgi:hypothetical protein
LGNPWGVDFFTMFHMSNDAGLFRTAKQLAEAGCVRERTDWIEPAVGPARGALAADEKELQGRSTSGAPLGGRRFVPLYEAKMISFFDHRAGSYHSRGDDRGYRVLPETSQFEYQDPLFEAEPFYWVAREEVEGRLKGREWKRQWLFGWKDITSATNERTTIAAVLPRVAIGNKIPLIFCKEDHLMPCLIANFSSIVFDFATRQKVGGVTLNFFLVKQFPVIPVSHYTLARQSFIVPRVVELTYSSHSLAYFARDYGYDGPPFRWDETRRALLRAELDAFFARAYGLSRSELSYILDPTYLLGPNIASETFRVLKEKEIQQYGQYRTYNLTLLAWDTMERDGTFSAMGF